jgi:lysophospholipase L1-like esterase
VLGPEVVIGAGWATASSGALGGDAWQQTTAGGMFEWTPTVPVSHFKWWNVWYGSDRVIAIFVDGVEVQRINTKSSPVAFVGTEIACPGGLGTHTLGLKYISGNAAGFHGLEAYNKDAKSVRIHNFGHGGGKTTEILEAGITDTQVGYPLNAIKTMAPDLVVLETGLNDTATEIANGTTAAALQAGIASLKQTSDVVLQIPNPSALARRSQVTQDQLTNIILDAGLRNGCPVINLRDVFGGSYDAGLAMGLYAGGADLVHPNAAGYVGEGYMLADLLMRA